MKTLSHHQKRKAERGKRRPSVPEPRPRYLDRQTLERHMEAIHNDLFRRVSSQADRQACKEIARGFTYVIPFVDRYALVMERVRITEEELRRCYTPEKWDRLPEPNKNQIRKAARKYEEGVALALRELTSFVNRQSLHLDQMKEELMEEVMYLEPEELDQMGIGSELEKKNERT